MSEQRADDGPIRILFLCTHNKARSQLAEGICRKLGGGRVVAHSAGSEPSAVHPCAQRVLAAMGIDAGGQRSKHMTELFDQTFDYVVNVCDQVREQCPVFPGTPELIHWSIEDPSRSPGSSRRGFSTCSRGPHARGAARSRPQPEARSERRPASRTLSLYMRARAR